MMYAAYQAQDDFMAPFRDSARLALSWWSMFDGSPLQTPAREMSAAMEMLSRFTLSHARPAFAIDAVTVGNREVPVVEEVALSLPFGDLLHFRKDIDAPQPKVLVVAPLSGHFATLLRGTVVTMLQDHDVYITDWGNARDVPLSEGKFGVDEYVDYLIRFFEEMGPDSHVLGICQPCVQTLGAVAVMSDADHPATPRSMTLMAGPIDTRESPTTVNDLAMSKPIEWFEQTLIATVPQRFPGARRRVYPGFVQLVSFMSMNMDRHRKAHEKMYKHLSSGETAEATKIKDFYDEYFAVLDLTEEFYIETVDRIFQKAELATGDFTHHGKPVDPGKIRKTALLTVEGGRDDICSIGQTAAAHDLCTALRPHLKRHHLQANVGHYGVFNGRRWENEIYPVVRNLILAME